MSSVDEARARELFLADIIRELSRQQQEDAASFSGARKSNCTAVFRKLCFDFPLVNDDDLAELLVSMTGLFQGSNDGIFRGNPFEEEFSLHEKFLENILFLCNSHSNEAEMAESVTHKSVSNSTKHQIAAVLFLVFPHYLLQCSDHRLMQLLGQDQLQRSWKDILLRFQSFIQLSTVSTIGCSTSNGIQQYLQDSECLSKLGDTIATLGVFTVQAERLLSDLEPLASASSSASSEEPSLTENSTTASASVEDPLDHLISMGMLSARTTSKDDRQVEGVKESATGAATGDRKKSVKSLKDMLQYVLVTATVYQSTQQSAASIKAVQVERLVGVLSVVKSCWLHLVFLYRDLLTQYPALIPSKAPVLFSALLSSPGGVGNGGGVSKMVAMKSDDFPSSAECMYVLVFCTLASHNAPSSASAPIGSSCTSTALASQIKTAFRTHLDTRSNLSEFVDLCVRMDKYASSGAKKNDTNVLRIDIEVQSFLIEVAMLYVDDLTRVTPRTGAGLQSNNAVSVLVASRLLPTLLFSAQALLAHEAKVANTGSHTVMPAGMAIFAAR